MGEQRVRDERDEWMCDVSCACVCVLCVCL